MNRSIIDSMNSGYVNGKSINFCNILQQWYMLECCSKSVTPYEEWNKKK